jgi:hypothetical protein
VSAATKMLFKQHCGSQGAEIVFSLVFLTNLQLRKCMMLLLSLSGAGREDSKKYQSVSAASFKLQPKA